MRREGNSHWVQVLIGESPRGFQPRCNEVSDRSILERVLTGIAVKLRGGRLPAVSAWL